MRFRELRTFFCQLILGLAIGSSALAGSSQSLVYQGRIVRPDGTVVNSGTVSFSLSVYSPAPKKCLLYSESQTLDMTGSLGMFSLPLGTGTRTDGGSHSFSQVFTNGSTLSSLTCADGSTSYAASSTDDRSLQVSFNDAGTVVSLSAMAIKSVPFALQAHEVDGWGLNNLVKVSSVGSPTTFTTAEMANAKLLTAPGPCNVNEILKWNGSAWGCSADATGGSPSDASYLAKGVFQADTDAATSGLVFSSGGVLKVNYGTAANQIVKLDASSKLPAVDGSALTNLNASNISSGTIPITRGGTGASTKTAAFDALSPNSAKGDITVYNGTNNISLPRGSDGQVLTTDSAQASGLKWANAAATGVTSLTAGTGLTGGTITSTGTLAVDVGTGANQIVQMTASSKLPAVDGSALTNLSSSQISAGTLPVSRGGTGASSLAANRLLASDGSGSSIQTVVPCSQYQVLSFDGSGNFGCYNLSSLGSGTYFAQNGNSFAAAAVLGTNDNNTLSFETNNSTRMTIDTSGNVGIGTTSPNTVLNIQGEGTSNFQGIAVQNSFADNTNKGAVAFVGARKINANLPYTGIGTWDDGATRFLYVGGGGWKMPDATRIEFYTAPTYNETNDSGVARMVINNAGNVGIGTTTPSYLLDVEGTSTTASASSQILNYSKLTVQPTADVTSGVRAAAWAQAVVPSGTVAISQVIGQYGYADNSGTGLVSNVNGGRFYADNYGSSTDIAGLRTTGENRATANTTSGINVEAYNYSGTTNDLSGMTVYLEQTGGTVVNRYAIKIESPSGAATNDYGIFQAGGQKNYFSGNVGINNNNPLSPLDVKGAIRLTGATSGYAGFQPAANAGSTIWTLPVVDGSAGQFLKTDGSGNLTWGSASTAAITSLNGLTAATQTFAIGTSGNSPNFSSATSTHTLNIPMANTASVTAGLISKTEYDTFNTKLGTSTSFSGDVSGAYNATSVDKIKGTPLSISSLSSGNFLKYNGAAWVNSALDASDISSGTLPVNRGGTGVASFSSNALVMTNGTGTAFTSMTCTLGQIVKWNGTAWGCNSDDQLLPDSNNNLKAGTSALGANTTGTYNVALGISALSSNTAGDYNVAIGREAQANMKTASGTDANISFGYQALKGSGTPASNTGTNNFAAGYQTLGLVTSGSNNAAIGQQALYNDGAGNNNLAIGAWALLYNLADNNIGLGWQAAMSNETGADNIAIGTAALNNNKLSGINIAVGQHAQMNMQPAPGDGLGGNIGIGRDAIKGSGTPANNTGTFNIGIGDWALQNITSGDNNVGIGNNPLQTLTSGTENVALGHNPLQYLTTGTENVGIGHSPLQATTTGTSNVAIGYLPLLQNTTGSNNVAIASNALQKNTTGQYNFAIGTNGLMNNTTSSGNVAFGSWSQEQMNSTSGYNTSVGDESLRGSGTVANNTGSFNTAIGNQALYTISTGTFNTAVGYRASRLNTTGSENVAIGRQALDNSVDSNRNIAIGTYAQALMNTPAGDGNNIAIGTAAMQGSGTIANNTGIQNIALGQGSMEYLSSGGANVAMGDWTLGSMTTGYYNVAIGVQAGYSGTAVTTGHDNTFLGFDSSFATASGQLSYATAIGSGSRVSTSNTVVLGRTSDQVAIGQTGAQSSYKFYVKTDATNTTIGGSVAWTNASDRRYKTNIEPIQNALETLGHLQGVRFDWDHQKFPNQFEKGRQIGFIAQQIEPYVPEIVRTDGNGYKGVQYSQLVALLTEAVKELYAKFLSVTGQQDRRIASLEEAKQQLESENKDLKSKNEELEKRLERIESQLQIHSK